MEKKKETTSQSKQVPSHKQRSTGFWVLLVIALATSAFVAWAELVSSPLAQAHWWVSVENYWLREFSDEPGVKPYAEALLKEDGSWLRQEIRSAITPPFYPIVFFVPVVALIAVAWFGVRRNTRLQYAMVILALLFVVCVVASKYMRPKYL